MLGLPGGFMISQAVSWSRGEATDEAPLGALGRSLASGTPGSLRNMALNWNDAHYVPFGDLHSTVQDGHTVYEHHHGVGAPRSPGRRSRRVTATAGWHAPLRRRSHTADVRKDDGEAPSASRTGRRTCECIGSAAAPSRAQSPRPTGQAGRRFIATLRDSRR
jgi:hypothetical protein